jgi:divalent metal cation (Fe/Co/Zn/Cd) transporter
VSHASTCADGCGAEIPLAPVGKAARQARTLAWASLVWMVVEGAIGLVAGYQASSAALIGWAMGSVVEGAASVIVIWRFTGDRAHSEAAEHRAQRAVAISFWLIAPYIAAQSIADLVGNQRPSSSALGIGVTVASLLVMPPLGIVKQRLGARLQSEATAGEGVQNLLCAAQAAAVLLALAVTAAWPGGWRIDPAIALLIAAWSVREGLEAWRGNDCC